MSIQTLQLPTRRNASATPAVPDFDLWDGAGWELSDVRGCLARSAHPGSRDSPVHTPMVIKPKFTLEALMVQCVAHAIRHQVQCLVVSEKYRPIETLNDI